MIGLNWAGMVVSAIATMVLGFLWYSPVLFGNQWMKLMGLSKEKMAGEKQEMGKTYGIMFVGALVMAGVLSRLVDMGWVVTAMEGAKLGIWIGIGFAAPVLLSTVLFEKKGWSLYLINAGYWVVSLAVMGAILAGWAW